MSTFSQRLLQLISEVKNSNDCDSINEFNELLKDKSQEFNKFADINGNKKYLCFKNYEIDIKESGDENDCDVSIGSNFYFYNGDVLNISIYFHYSYLEGFNDEISEIEKQRNEKNYFHVTLTNNGNIICARAVDSINFSIYDIYELIAKRNNIEDPNVIEEFIHDIVFCKYIPDTEKWYDDFWRELIEYNFTF